MKLEERITKALDLKKLRLPQRPKVEEIKVEPYLDSTGDPALHVWVIVAEDTPDDDRIWPQIEPIQDAVRAALEAADVSDWPYFWYRKRSELTAASA